MLKMFSCIGWRFVLLSNGFLSKFALYWLDYLFFLCFKVLILCISLIITACWFNSWQIFSLMSLNYLIFYYLKIFKTGFYLVCVEMFMCWNPICQSLILCPEQLKSYVVCSCLYLHLQSFPLCLSLDVKEFDPFELFFILAKKWGSIFSIVYVATQSPYSNC